MGLLYPFSSKIISGALYHLVVTLKVSFAIGLDMTSLLLILDCSEMPLSYYFLVSNFFVLDLTNPFFFFSSTAGGFFCYSLAILALEMSSFSYLSSSLESSTYFCV
jgi:hypothetical protein